MLVSTNSILNASACFPFVRDNTLFLRSCTVDVLSLGEKEKLFELISNVMLLWQNLVRDLC